MPRFLARALLVFGLCSVVPACGGSTSIDPAKQAAGKADTKDAELEAALKKRKEEREAKQADAKRAEEAKQAELDALAGLPDKMPKKIGKACDAVADAQMAFLERSYEGETLEKLKSAQGTQRPLTVKQCMDLNNLKVAACQKQALEKATPELKKEMAEIMRVCIKAYQPTGGGKAAAVPKKPGR